MLVRRLFTYLLPVLAYAGIIFFLSSQSSLPPTPGHGFDKLAHFLEYFGLAFLVARAFVGFGFAAGRAIGFAFLLSVAFGASDEIHQMFTPNRVPDWYDLMADAFGSISGAFGYLWFWRKRRTERASV